ncbi:hypothetical protein [Bradyrhizobium sp. CER78]|uniref:hypothetical protein n=1 Tax=Bradyrhizobium sp. CER78 TaxID=3039162 RepID=UPI00244A4678|nr:hypothetical protein [Bradyrhizobium sp. CER78]MDH2386410.1 hypothetical protein [Bradyrhizobium sp. CER78]
MNESNISKSPYRSIQLSQNAVFQHIQLKDDRDQRFNWTPVVVGHTEGERNDTKIYDTPCWSCRAPAMFSAINATADATSSWNENAAAMRKVAALVRCG